MQATLTVPLTRPEQDRAIALTVQRERGRLLALIRRSIADASEAEYILQEALYELVVAYRMLQPVQQAGAWLARVARNRIIDRFRRKTTRSAPAPGPDEAEPGSGLGDLLPAADADAESAVMREGV